jgi:hypothetical protein
MANGPRVGRRFVTLVIKIADELSEIIVQRTLVFCPGLSRPVCATRDTPKPMLLKREDLMPDRLRARQS